MERDLQCDMASCMNEDVSSNNEVVSLYFYLRLFYSVVYP